uniref:Lipoprotein n=1 Tax=Strongyloides papillosus TaxID=174720 RepID=A0A0N5BI25_STREA
MEKLLKVLWILAVYSIHLSSCDDSLERDKHFKYYYKDAITFDESFPRKYFVTKNTEIIAIKCPLGYKVKRNETLTVIYKRPSDSLKESLKRPSDSLKESLSFENIRRNVYEWRIYEIGKIESIKINCLNVYGNDENHLLAEWNHVISRTQEEIDIRHRNPFNIMSHIPGKNIIKSSGSEKTVAFSGKSNYREFNLKNPKVYKGDSLVIFDAEEMDSYKNEFLEPISIVRPYHPVPSINIIGITNIKNNTKDKEWSLVEVENFPKGLEIKLEYNGETRQRDFFQYEKINVYYFDFTKENEFYNYKNMTLEPDQNGKKIFQLEHPAIVKFE